FAFGGFEEPACPAVPPVPPLELPPVPPPPGSVTQSRSTSHGPAPVSTLSKTLKRRSVYVPVLSFCRVDAESGNSKRRNCPVGLPVSWCSANPSHHNCCDGHSITSFS